MPDDRALGVFDSGVGGLTVVRAVEDSAGEFAGVQAIGGTGMDQANALALTPDGTSAWVTGSFSTTVNFRPGSATPSRRGKPSDVTTTGLRPASRAASRL